MANLCCSIEFEPRTLKQGQIDHAREIAVDIVQKNEPDEASTIFIEGLKPVLESKETESVVVVSELTLPPKAAEELRREVVNGHIFVEKCCQCSSGLAVESSPEEFRVKEPLSAPF